MGTQPVSRARPVGARQSPRRWTGSGRQPVGRRRAGRALVSAPSPSQGAQGPGRREVKATVCRARRWSGCGRCWSTACAATSDRGSARASQRRPEVHRGESDAAGGFAQCPGIALVFLSPSCPTPRARTNVAAITRPSCKCNAGQPKCLCAGLHDHTRRSAAGQPST
jgi:hypothetical protein